MLFIIANMTSFINKENCLQHVQTSTMMKMAGSFHYFTLTVCPLILRSSFRFQLNSFHLNLAISKFRNDAYSKSNVKIYMLLDAPLLLTVIKLHIWLP